MRFLFVSPRTEYLVRPLNTWMPLGVASLAASLKEKGHEVDYFDRHTCSLVLYPGSGRLNEMLKERVRLFKPDVIGFTTISSLIYDTVECVSQLRPIFAGPIIAGGHHVTALPEESLRKIDGLDGVVVGEGERAMVEFASGNDPRHIPGFCWKDHDGSIHQTPPVQITSLDDLPFPDYSLLDKRIYLQRNHMTIRGYFLSSLSMITSRGCVQRCEFCSESLTYGKGVRFHSPDYVIRGIRSLLVAYPIDGIYFHDNDFLINRKRAEEICDGIRSLHRERQFQWAVQARADRIDRDIVRQLKKAGCVLIEIGVETSFQEKLNALGKNTRVEEVEEAIALCRSIGMSVHAYMITGLAGETMDTLDSELAWVKRVKPHSFSWSHLSLHPGTVLYEKAGQRFFESHEWDRENILSFYNHSSLSTVPDKTKKTWLRRHYTPYNRKTYQWQLIKNNYPRRIVSMIVMQGIREIRKLSDILAKFFIFR